MRTIHLLLVTACAGEAPPDLSQPDAAGAALPVETARLRGVTRDHFVPATPLPGATVQSDGVVPVLDATSSDDGEYLLERVPVGSKLFVTASFPGYRPTRSPAAVAATDATRDLELVSIADARRQYTTLGRAPSSGRAIAIAALEDEAGKPLGGLALSQIGLVDATGAAVPGVLGPYAFGTAGDVDPAATATVLGGDRVRVAYLDLPPGAYELRVGAATETFAVAADGAAVLAVRATAPAQANPDPRFAADVHPRLQTAANGGLGCANCHTRGGSGGVLELDGLPELVLGRLSARAGAIDGPTPALLARPLYERTPAPPDHPNASFLDTSDPDYQLIQRWIAGGAKP